jgi:hypothetical protein
VASPWGSAALTDSVKKNICGQTMRELAPGTLQVYFFMKGYGALEVGVHPFHHPGHEDTIGVGEGKFIHLWQFMDGAGCPTLRGFRRVETTNLSITEFNASSTSLTCGEVRHPRLI